MQTKVDLGTQQRFLASRQLLADLRPNLLRIQR